MNSITQAVSNLDLMSASLKKIANDPKNYNNWGSQYLENMSYEMAKYSEELQQMSFSGWSI